MERLKKHYAMIIAAASFLCLGVVNGVLLNCYSLLVVPICTDLGIPRSQMQLSQTLMGIGTILVPMLSGRIYAKYRFMRLMRIAAVLTILTYLSLSFARSILMIYISALALSICATLVSWIPFSIVINNWFIKSRGTAIGAVFMSSGVFGMLASIAGGFLIESIGWRAMVRVNSAITAAVVLPLIFFVIYERPEQLGLLPYGADENSETGKPDTVNGGLLFHDEIRRPRLWLMLISILLTGFCVNSLTSSMNAYFRDIGRSASYAANISAGYMASLAAGKILLGILYDRFGARKATLFTLAALLLTHLSLVLVHIPGAIAVVIACSGPGAAFATVALPEISKQSFGNRDYNSFTGVINGFCNAGGALSPSIFGIIRDCSGSYLPGFTAAIFITAASGILLLSLISKPSAKEA